MAIGSSSKGKNLHVKDYSLARAEKRIPILVLKSDKKIIISLLIRFFIIIVGSFTDRMKIFALNVLYRGSFVENCVCSQPLELAFCCEDVCAAKDEILFFLCSSIFCVT